MQSTSYILMIRPVHFRSNEQTLASNAFQTLAQTDRDISPAAVGEFDGFVDVLLSAGIEVFVVNDTARPQTPDSIFPNNWISFHDDGTVVLYPMMAENRRLERRPEILDLLVSKGFRYTRVLDLSYFEQQHLFLEGTGSMVLDRERLIAYACLSPRTDEKVLDVFCAELGYQKVVFQAHDRQGMQIYHTNVMMCVGSDFVLVCLESITDSREREKFSAAVHESGKILIEISFEQMEHFAGNMLEVRTFEGEPALVMSSSAYQSLGPEAGRLRTFAPLVHASLEVIETNGGGSARCMMAEIHLPRTASN